MRSCGADTWRRRHGSSIRHPDRHDDAGLKRYWTDIQDRLISDIDADYGVYEGRTFKADRFAAWLTRTGIPWPRLESGNLDLIDKIFRDMARAHPAVRPLRELRHALSEMRLNDLAVGPDGRNRALLSAFRGRNGRNQPSNTQFIFGPSVWLRGLIKPPPGYGIAYIDCAQQEFGIAAALSGDPKMKEAYRSGDPYLAFAKQAGAVRADATKQSHKAQRDQFKACVLAVQYGMGPESLAARIDQPPIRARELSESSSADTLTRRLIEILPVRRGVIRRWTRAVNDDAAGGRHHASAAGRRRREYCPENRLLDVAATYLRCSRSS